MVGCQCQEPSSLPDGGTRTHPHTRPQPTVWAARFEVGDLGLWESRVPAQMTTTRSLINWTRCGEPGLADINPRNQVQVPEACQDGSPCNYILLNALDNKETVCVIETHYSTPLGSGRVRDSFNTFLKNKEQD